MGFTLRKLRNFAWAKQSFSLLYFLSGEHVFMFLALEHSKLRAKLQLFVRQKSIPAGFLLKNPNQFTKAGFLKGAKRKKLFPVFPDSPRFTVFVVFYGCILWTLVQGASLQSGALRAPGRLTAASAFNAPKVQYHPSQSTLYFNVLSATFIHEGVTLHS